MTVRGQMTMRALVERRTSLGTDPYGGVATPYEAEAVNLAGGGLTRETDLVGNADGKKGIVSFWFKINGGDGTDMFVYEGRGVAGTERPKLFRHSDGKLWIFHKDTAGATALGIRTVLSYTASAPWKHFLASWDMAIPGSARLYVTDVSDLDEFTFVDATLDYSGPDFTFDLGANRVNTQRFNGCVADFYYNYTEYLDFDIEANRRRFIGASLRPVDLGLDGSLPTGRPPILYFSGDFATWRLNDGTGGDFTVNGMLSACVDNPPKAGALALSTLPCFVWSQARREVVDGGKSALVEDMRALFPLTADLKEGDEISAVQNRLGAELLSGRFEVETIQRKHTHIEAFLQRVQS